MDLNFQGATAQALDSQFGLSLDREFPNLSIPRGLSYLLSLMCGNSKEINLQCEREVRGGQGNRVLQEQRRK